MGTFQTTRPALRSGISNRGSTVVLAGFGSGSSKTTVNVASLLRRLKSSGLSAIYSEGSMTGRLADIAVAIVGIGSTSTPTARLTRRLFEEPAVRQAQHTIVLFNAVSDRNFSRVLRPWLTSWPDAIFVRNYDEVVTLALQYSMLAKKERTLPAAVPEPKSIESLPRMLELGEALRDPESHELDAKRIAKLFDLQHAEIARWADISPQALDQQPTSESLQPILRLLERVGRLRIMRQIDEEKLRQWFKTPLPRLEQHTPFELFQGGSGERVADLVDNLVSGQLN